MTKLILYSSFLSVFFPTYGQVVIIPENVFPPYEISIDFDDTSAANYFYMDSLQVENLWEIGTPGKTILNDAYSPFKSMITDSIDDYPINNISSFEFAVLSSDHTYISFWHKMDTDAGLDGGVVEVSEDNGLTWANIITLPAYTLTDFYSTPDLVSSAGTAGFSGTSVLWTNVNIHKYAVDARFRFTFYSDGIETGKGGWQLDDLQVSVTLTGLDEHNLDHLLKIYPNPVKDQLELVLSDELSIGEVSITNMSGKVIYRGISTSISAEYWDTGIYFVRVMTDKGIIRQKFMKD